MELPAMIALAVVLAVLSTLAWPPPTSAADRLRAMRQSHDADDMLAAAPRSSASRDEVLSRTSLSQAGTSLSAVSRPGPPQARGRSKGVAGIGRQELGIAAPVALLVFLVVGGIPGMLAGTSLGACVAVVASRREPAEIRRRRERMTADLPFSADLMVACLRAGQPLSAAIDTAAEAVEGPLGERLSWVGGQMRLGADPEVAWAALADERALASLARTMTRAVQSGAPVADVLTRLADDARQGARAASSAAARRVGVQAVAPLGLCFLPAFVFLGIIPVVAGLAAQVLLP
jgi:Flp pilus assembly protein TadB